MRDRCGALVAIGSSHINEFATYKKKQTKETAMSPPWERVHRSTVTSPHTEQSHTRARVRACVRACVCVLAQAWAMVAQAYGARAHLGQRHRRARAVELHVAVQAKVRVRACVHRCMRAGVRTGVQACALPCRTGWNGINVTNLFFVFSRTSFCGRKI